MSLGYLHTQHLCVIKSYSRAANVYVGSIVRIPLYVTINTQCHCLICIFSARGISGVFASSLNVAAAIWLQI